MKQGCVIASFALAVCLVAPVTQAGDSEGGAAAAESLFQEARKAMESKRYSEACPKFLASQKLAPAIGTLLNLADCYEKNNQLASAWARFHEAIAMAQRLNRPTREQTARERADKLEPRLIKLSIQSKATNIDVKLDGNTIDPAALGTPIPVDAGKHTLEASAKGKKTFTTTVEVSDTKNKTPSVEIPPLEDAPEEKTDGPKVIEPPKEQGRGWSGQKTLGVVVASAGVIGLGVGGFFGLRTSSQWKEAQTHCNGNECDQTGVNLAAQAKSSGNIATIASIAGGALLIGGAVLFFTASDGGSSAKSHGPVRVGIGPGSLVLGGTFQ
ncbi:MAG: hypothetical protein KIT84_10105 [Labilithrix sp.]|nr:hypothetical protein [Labilithrix sp.]MCW5811356.1 hypothetical protein [Labilithrix sp.]